jgi:internalin A
VVFESALFPDPRVIGGLNVSRIKSLSFRFVKFTAWTFLAKFQSLEELELYLHNQVDWTTICSFRTLKRLCIVYGGIKSLSGIERLQNLESLSLLNNLGITSIAEIVPLRNLKDVHLSGAQVADLALLKQLPQINTLEWHDCPSEDYTPLADLTTLTELDLYHANVTEGTFLAPLTHLQTLNLEGTSIVDLAPLANLHALETLNLSWTPIHDLTPLANLPRLTTLDLSGTKLPDLSPLAKNPHLRELSLINGLYMDLSPLEYAPNLHLLHFRESRDPRVIAQLGHLEHARPDLKIELYPLC